MQEGRNKRTKSMAKQWVNWSYRRKGSFLSRIKLIPERKEGERSTLEGTVENSSSASSILCPHVCVCERGAEWQSVGSFVGIQDTR